MNASVDFETLMTTQVSGHDSEVQRGKLAAMLGFMTEQQVMLLAGVREATMLSWRKQSKGPRSVQFGNEPLYAIDDVRAYLSELAASKKDRSSLRTVLA